MPATLDTLCLVIIAVCSIILTVHFVAQAVGAHVATRRVATKRPREHDTGHVITGIGYTWECSCGETGDRYYAWNAAMQAGREHAAEHAEPKAAA